MTSLCSPFQSPSDARYGGYVQDNSYASATAEQEALVAIAEGEARLREHSARLRRSGEEMPGWSHQESTPGLISFEELAEFRDKHALISKQALRSTLGELGIPWTYPFQIDRDQHGRLHVNGALPERFRSRLEQSLDVNEDFLHSFQAAASTTCIMESAIQSRDFYRAYEEDSSEALERFSWLIGARWDCRIDFDDGDISFSVFRVN